MMNGPEQEARDKLFLSQLGKQVKAPFPSRWTCPEVQPWLYGYDAYKEVDEVLEKEPITHVNGSCHFARNYNAINQDQTNKKIQLDGIGNGQVTVLARCN